jgi:NAD(P)-dependent dehydrogenase (short-subunit alcohol dehydrogenase family)
VGREHALMLAAHGAKVVVNDLGAKVDGSGADAGPANEVVELIKKNGGEAVANGDDVSSWNGAKNMVDQAIKTFGKLDVLVNNAAEQHPKGEIGEITPEQIERTFRTNIFGYFYMVQAAMPHLKKGAAIINTASVTAYRGSSELLDYSATKGAIVAFTRSLAQKLAEQGIRVNGVAPGPIWTPLIPSTFPEEKVKTFGANTPLKRPGQPNEVAPSYLFLACEDASYITGSILHPNGGDPTES